MFRDQGSRRSDRQNRLLAGYLALTGGFVNSAGFVLLGTFTSHATGSVGRFANDVALSHFGAAGGALTMLASFLAGAFVASMMIESHFMGNGPGPYGAVLAIECLTLLFFVGAATLAPPRAAHLPLEDMEATILCAAMGMQNSLVTRLSGAVVRTTHLTGVITDIGIEGARWFRWWRGRLSERLRIKLAFGPNPPERPSSAKIGLLVTIAGAFAGGAILGAEGALAARQWALLLPCGGLATGAVYAFWTQRASSLGLSLPPQSRA